LPFLFINGLTLLKYLTLLLLLLVPAVAHADFTGKVVAVKDGDTVVVLDDSNHPVKVRLQGIDAPELKQPYGREAKKYAASLVYGQTVTVREAGTDRYGRTLGDLILPDGRSMQEEMLRAGYAWHYTHYDSSQRLADLEAEARTAQRGLWADLNPTPPWEFRHDERLEKDKSHSYRQYRLRRRY
jgi:micrococcal nuclease